MGRVYVIKPKDIYAIRSFVNLLCHFFRSRVLSCDQQSSVDAVRPGQKKIRKEFKMVSLHYM